MKKIHALVAVAALLAAAAGAATATRPSTDPSKLTSSPGRLVQPLYDGASACSGKTPCDVAMHGVPASEHAKFQALDKNHVRPLYTDERNSKGEHYLPVTKSGATGCQGQGCPSAASPAGAAPAIAGSSYVEPAVWAHGKEILQAEPVDEARGLRTLTGDLDDVYDEEAHAGGAPAAAAAADATHGADHHEEVIKHAAEVESRLRNEFDHPHHADPDFEGVSAGADHLPVNDPAGLVAEVNAQLKEEKEEEAAGGKSGHHEEAARNEIAHMLDEMHKEQLVLEHELEEVRAVTATCHACRACDVAASNPCSAECAAHQAESAACQPSAAQAAAGEKTAEAVANPAAGAHPIAPHQILYETDQEKEDKKEEKVEDALEEMEEADEHTSHEDTDEAASKAAAILEAASNDKHKAKEIEEKLAEESEEQQHEQQQQQQEQEQQQGGGEQEQQQQQQQAEQQQQQQEKKEEKQLEHDTDESIGEIDAADNDVLELQKTSAHLAKLQNAAEQFIASEVAKMNDVQALGPDTPASVKRTLRKNLKKHLEENSARLLKGGKELTEKELRLAHRSAVAKAFEAQFRFRQQAQQKQQAWQQAHRRARLNPTDDLVAKLDDKNLEKGWLKKLRGDVDMAIAQVDDMSDYMIKG